MLENENEHVNEFHQYLQRNATHSWRTGELKHLSKYNTTHRMMRTLQHGTCDMIKLTAPRDEKTSQLILHTGQCLDGGCSTEQ